MATRALHCTFRPNGLTLSPPTQRACPRLPWCKESTIRWDTYTQYYFCCRRLNERVFTTLPALAGQAKVSHKEHQTLNKLQINNQDIPSSFNQILGDGNFIKKRGPQNASRWHAVSVYAWWLCRHKILANRIAKNAEFLGLFTIPLCGQNHNISSILHFTFQLRWAT